MSLGRHSSDPNAPVSLARLVAVGLLLVVVTVAAGRQSSVQARGTQEHPGFSPMVATAEASEAPQPKPTVQVPDAIPAFAPVPPHRPLPAFNRKAYLGRAIAFVANDKGEVALTFDDGPSKDTRKILRILRQQGAHATFFLVGERAQYADATIRSAVVQGEEIASHTWSHQALRQLDATMTATQIDRAQAVLAAESGTVPAFVRPRGGKFDATGRKALADRGIVLAVWSVHANDVLHSPPPDKLVSNVVNAAKPGSIILLHETNPNTVKALPKILAGLRAKGLHSVTLSQLLADGRP